MTLAERTSDRAFRYAAVGRDGRSVRDVVSAPDRRSALTRLSAEGLVVTRLDEAAPPKPVGKNRPLKTAERVLVLRQLALMLEAGVSLLEALQTVAAGIEAIKGREELNAVANALKQGESFGRAMAQHAPGFPFYVYAMTRVGEASGRIGEVLGNAAEQMAYEDGLRRDFLNAMTYPGFLLSAGVAAILFIFTQVVPRFSAMVGDDRSNMPAISRYVIGIGDFANANLLPLGIGGGIAAFLLAGALSSPQSRRALYDFAHNIPVLGGILKSREITAWSRLTAFALTAGVPLLEAAALSRQATPEGAFRRGLTAFEADLRGGVSIDASLARHTRLSLMDLSLLRTGQRTGALARMFGFLADSYDAKLRDQMKRLTALMEPIAIGAISVIVGIVALSLVLALSSVYDTVG